jgi:small nuclear ribonucleoprotein (snRNP)-like protein
MMMKKEELKKFLNKSVRVNLNNNFNYSGKVISVSDDSLSLIDKFNHIVMLNNSAIISIEVI